MRAECAARHRSSCNHRDLDPPGGFRHTPEPPFPAATKRYERPHPMRDTGEFLFTSESVSEGHPDKVADRLSDTVLDAYLAADPYSRVACETLVTTHRVVFG